MKKTISINIAGLAFQIDDDAYNRLELYLEKIKETFPNEAEQTEIINDIEHRFAELFMEKLGKTIEVVNLKMVNEAIETLGEVSFIEEEEQQESSSHKKETGTKKLFRNPDDKIIAGVLGGLAAFIGMDAVWLRLIFVILGIASVGVPVGLIYIILWVVMPEAKTTIQKMQMRGEPININNLSDTIKKNFNSETLADINRRGAQSAGEIIRLFAKIAVLIFGAIIFFKLIIFSFVWFLGIGFINFFSSDFIGLFFDSQLAFLLFAFSLFFFIAIPALFLLYILFKAYRRTPISWGKTFGLATFFGFLSLIGIVIALLLSAKNYKTEHFALHDIQTPLVDSVKTVDVFFEETDLEGDFEFYVNNSGFYSEGIKYDVARNTLFLNAVKFQLEPSEADTFALIASTFSRGRNKQDAQTHIDKFSFQVNFKENNQLRIPTTLEFKNENKFRMQRLVYTLEVPIGTEITFSDNAENYVKDVALSNSLMLDELSDNTWIMNRTGLECITCKE